VGRRRRQAIAQFARAQRTNAATANQRQFCASESRATSAVGGFVRRPSCTAAERGKELAKARPAPPLANRTGGGYVAGSTLLRNAVLRRRHGQERPRALDRAAKHHGALRMACGD